MGAAVTIGINFYFIPLYGYWASAWATLLSYFVMMTVSYFLGQHFYPVPYHMRKITLYLVVSIGLSAVSYYVLDGSLLAGNLFLLLFLGLILYFEKDTLKQLRRN